MKVDRVAFGGFEVEEAMKGRKKWREAGRDQREGDGSFARENPFNQHFRKSDLS